MADSDGPAAFLILATSALETVRSTVTTTFSVVGSTYQATPRTPEACTPWLAARARALSPWPGIADAGGGTSAALATRPSAAASSVSSLIEREWEVLLV